MPLPGCPEWRYDAHPERVAVLARKSAEVIADVRLGRFDASSDCSDTRPIHSRLFEELTPAGHRYFAGNYRGSVEHRCLETLSVGVASDPEVGLPPKQVATIIGEFGVMLRSALQQLDIVDQVRTGGWTPEDRLYVKIVVAARAFQEFLTIHPYADGNGHIARFLVWLVLGRYGIWPERWTIEPRPMVAGYGLAISAHRRRNFGDLEQMIYQSLLPPTA